MFRTEKTLVDIFLLLENVFFKIPADHLRYSQRELRTINNIYIWLKVENFLQSYMSLV